jgi:hypothetical protein
LLQLFLMLTLWQMSDRPGENVPDGDSVHAETILLLVVIVVVLAIEVFMAAKRQHRLIGNERFGSSEIIVRYDG